MSATPWAALFWPALFWPALVLGVSPRCFRGWGLKESANHHLLPRHYVKNKVGVKKLELREKGKGGVLWKRHLPTLSPERIHPLSPCPLTRESPSTWATALAGGKMPFSPSPQWHRETRRESAGPTAMAPGRHEASRDTSAPTRDQKRLGKPLESSVAEMAPGVLVDTKLARSRQGALAQSRRPAVPWAALGKALPAAGER